MIANQWHQNGKKDCALQNVTRKITYRFGLHHFPTCQLYQRKKKA